MLDGSPRVEAAILVILEATLNVALRPSKTTQAAHDKPLSFELRNETRGECDAFRSTAASKVATLSTSGPLVPT